MLPAAVTSIPSPIPHAAPAFEVHVPDPDTFEGNPSTLDAFLDSCVKLFRSEPTVYSSTEIMVRVALSYIKGDATQLWSKALFRDINNGDFKFTTWDAFVDRIKESFGNPHAREDAQFRMLTITQGSCTAEEFFKEFDAVTALSDFNEIAVVFALKRAVHPEVLAEANRIHPRPTSYADWKALLLQVDHNLRRIYSETRFFAALNRSRRFTPFPLSSPSAITTRNVYTPQTSACPFAHVPHHAPAPATNFSPARWPWPWPCWNCGAVGHLMRDCTLQRKYGDRVHTLLDHLQKLDASLEALFKILESIEESEEYSDDDYEAFDRVCRFLYRFLYAPTGERSAIVGRRLW